MKFQLTYKMKLLLFMSFITIVILLSVKFLLPYFIPFIFSYWLAKYANPIVYYLNQKFRIPVSLSGIITLLLFASIIALFGFFFIDALINQINIFLSNIPSYRSAILSRADNLCIWCDGFFKNKQGTTINFFNKYLSDFSQTATSKIVPCITNQTICIMKKLVSLVTTSFIMLFSALLIIMDRNNLKELFHKCTFYKDINRVLKLLSETGLQYLKIQFFIICTISLICTTGLFINGNSYPLLLGILISILDALPLFGSGTILVPWAIIKLFSHNITGAAILISTYLICQVTRQFLESRLLGDTLGLAPIYFVMSLFIGIKFFGLSGVVLGPFSVLLIKSIYKLYKPYYFKNES